MMKDSPISEAIEGVAKSRSGDNTCRNSFCLLIKCKHDSLLPNILEYFIYTHQPEYLKEDLDIT